ncbi:hypothetical protein ACXGXA_24805, partial [Salmonella enterica subsp. enterica serovar Infantis]
NVDIWNYMHFLVPGALAYFVFDSFFLGLGVAVALSVAALFIGNSTMTPATPIAIGTMVVMGCLVNNPRRQPTITPMIAGSPNT